MGGKLLTVDEELQIRKFFDANVAPALAAKQLKRSTGIVQRRYKSLRDSKTRKPNGRLDIAFVHEKDSGWAKAFTKNELDAGIELTVLKRHLSEARNDVDRLRSANEALTRRNHELLRALSIVRAAADVEPKEVPF